MFLYAALGDSITFGQNASTIDKAYPYRIVSMLHAKGLPAKTVVVARPGWTSVELAGALHEEPCALSFAKTASVWIGGNDILRYGLPLLQGISGNAINGAIHQYKRRLDGILGLIRSTGLKNVVCCTQYNPFPRSTIALKATAILNQTITESAAKNGCLVARVDQWFSGNEARLIDGYRSGYVEEAVRGFAAVHPNDEGHRIIAEGMLPLVYINK